MLISCINNALIIYKLNVLNSKYQTGPWQLALSKYNDIFELWNTLGWLGPNS